MSARSNRREFLRRSTASLAGLAGLSRLSALPRFVIAKDPAIARGYPANEKLRVGVVGVSGQGGANLGEVAKSSSAEIVALCDVDANLLGAAAANFPQAKQHRDFRKMIDAGGLDCAVISTPDHCHAPATAAALRAKLHVYCEKPLTHSVKEARFVIELAKKQGVATQMGTQIHALDNYRRVVELVRSGAIGEITEVHDWVGNDYGGKTRPKETPPVPANLDWDLWLGPAPERPYSPEYCPFAWRNWWDFGSGSLGDMACHHMDLPYWALDLEDAVTVEADGPPVDAESTPKQLTVKYTIKRKGGAVLPLTWYDGGRRPHHFADGLLPKWGNGTLFVGKKGMLLADYDKHVLLPEKDFAGFTPPPQTIAKSLGHHEEWLQSAKGGAKSLCEFSYSGRLAETVLLGNVAFRSGAKLTWDAVNLKTGDPKADAFLSTEYRKGWTL